MSEQQILIELQELPNSEKKAVFEILSILIEKFKKGIEKPTDKSEPSPRLIGALAGGVLYMADDFDAPLDDFKDYM